jgi:cation:H+ antiporter
MLIGLWFLILFASLYIVVKSADFFTKYSEKIGVLFGLSSFIIGATIVAIGTSLPELITSLFAVHAGETSFVADNVIGSNIANSLLILGIAGIIAKTLTIKTSLIDADLPFFFMSMGLFTYFSLDRLISTGEGLALLIFFIIFIIYSIRQKPEKKDSDETKDFLQNNKTKIHERNFKTLAKYTGIIIVSAGFLSFASKYTVDSILEISRLMNISSTLLTITVVSLGTSLPEILTSISAVRRGNHGIAIGNVLGSNTFNLLFIIGVPALIRPLSISSETFIIGIPFLILATLTTIFVILDNKIRSWEGIGLLLFYFIFILKILGII